MGPQFDRRKADSWYADACKALAPHELALLWVYLAYDAVDDLMFPVPYKIWNEWHRLTIWEKQAALYLFGPTLEKNANHQAWLKSQQAREIDPL